MSFSYDAGYTPMAFEQLMDFVRVGVNDKIGTSYTTESFVGTNFYRYFYALIQKLQIGETKTSEIFVKLQQYFTITNEKVNRPRTTAPGIDDYLEDNGYPIVSIKAPLEADAGKLYVCVDVDDGADDYPTKKLEICTLLKNAAGAGIVTMGTESEAITLSNGQSFDFKFNLPDKTPMILRATIVLSENNQFAVQSPTWIKQRIWDNIEASYGLGKNFEPQRYLSIVDTPWAETVLLEWSTNDGADWFDTVIDAAYDDLYTLDSIDDIEVVES